MSKGKKTLFDPIVPKEKLHPLFDGLRTAPGGEPARWMLDEVYQSFEDPDGNFLEQFQTSGFNARFFELYLFAYFSRSGFIVERSKPNPDFLVSRGGIRVAVEATTTNPSTSGVLAEAGRKISDLKGIELDEYEQHELPIRFGGPLSSKLDKRYWELEHCKGLPFVVAIEAFHEEDSLLMADGGLIRYLYGNEEIGIWDQGGQFRVETRAIKEHTVGDKTIPSGFFLQPEAQCVSAVLFTNSGSNAKFSRMGYQHGVGCDVISMTRIGYCFNPRHDVMDPTFFLYNLDGPPFVEPWGQGLVVLHNPNALNPLPERFFVDALESHLEQGVLRSYPSHWHPLSSQTLTSYLGEGKLKDFMDTFRPIQCTVAAISQEQFREYCDGYAAPASLEENGWLMDETFSFAGLVLRDKADNDWGYAVLGRDTQFCFRAITNRRDFATRYEARIELQRKIAELLSHSQRIFPGPLEDNPE
jgi:hypothetical protein